MKETCVICGATTPYKVTDNIGNRLWFIEGSGQLCKKCYNRLYK